MKSLSLYKYSTTLIQLIEEHAVTGADDKIPFKSYAAESKVMSIKPTVNYHNSIEPDSLPSLWCY